MAMVMAVPCQIPVFAQYYMVPVMAPVAAPVMLTNMAGVSTPLVAAAVPPPVVDCSQSASDVQGSTWSPPVETPMLEPNCFDTIAKDALRLSRDYEGCRLVQKALEEAGTDEACTAIAAVLRGHVWEVATCPHANHVLQKCVVMMKPSECQFVVDELMGQGPGIALKLARHKYGYRVFQRLLEHLVPEQTAQLVEGLVANCASLSMHRHGTYVIQQLLEHGTDEQRRQTVAALVPEMEELSLNNDACMVLDAALAKCDSETQDDLVQAILESEGAVSAMAHTRRGHVAVLSLLRRVEGEALESARRQLAEQASSLKKTRFGRLVLNFARLDGQGAGMSP